MISFASASFFDLILGTRCFYTHEIFSMRKKSHVCNHLLLPLSLRNLADLGHLFALYVFLLICVILFHITNTKLLFKNSIKHQYSSDAGREHSKLLLKIYWIWSNHVFLNSHIMPWEKASGVTFYFFCLSFFIFKICMNIKSRQQYFKSPSRKFKTEQKCVPTQL